MAFFNFFDVSLSILVLVLALANGIILAVEWKIHRRHDTFLLLWALAFLFLYLYKVPFILSQAGVASDFASFSLFSAAAIPFSIAGMALIAIGINSIVPFKRRCTLRELLIAGVVAASVFSILALSGIPSALSAIPTWGLVFAFYLPVQLILFLTVINLFLRAGHLLSPNSRAGLLFLTTGITSQTVLSYLYFTTLRAYPADMWFTALLNSENIPVLQSINVLAIIVGVLLLERQCQALAALLWGSEHFDHGSSIEPKQNN